MSHHRVTTDATVETYDVPADRIGEEMRAIRRAGGVILRSGPSRDGYAVVVQWR